MLSDSGKKSWLFHRLTKLQEQVHMEPVYELAIAQRPRLAAVLNMV